ncbi:Sec-independent protein translocase protein TatB [Martelella alba]|uniref:Sec-independent protein translocase protein TatB n=1 Tax=Martelella alba TaxID=2590451 RepID=A0ABY2SNM0_9HYPH|nr:Sec-independent protein translocase protein TatB [Martelella alba]TKI07129.1 Sec-independent protein translocase subunit TatB [Martelella alba]
MFDIGFGELALVFVIGLVVLGPERLPVAVRTVVGWIRALRSMAATVQNELSQELKLQELQDSLKKVEEASKANMTPELKASMEELREAADSMKKTFNSKLVVDEPDQPNTIHNPVVTHPQASHEGVTPADGAGRAQSPAMAPEPPAQTESAVPEDSARAAENSDEGIPADETKQPTVTAQAPSVTSSSPNSQHDR